MAIGSTAHLHKDGWQGEGVPCFFGLVLACVAAALGESFGSALPTAISVASMSLACALWQRLELTSVVIDMNQYNLSTEMIPTFHPKILVLAAVALGALVFARNK